MLSIRHIPLFFLFSMILTGLDAENGEPFGNAVIRDLEKNEYYRLPLPPSLQKYCTANLRDLRIHHEGKLKTREIPYILDRPDPYDPFHEKRNLKILEKQSLSEGGVRVELEDPSQRRISALALKVDQGTVSRSIRITASDDQEDWKEVHSGKRYHDERYPDGTRRFVLRDLGLQPHAFYRIHVGAKGRGLDPRILKATVIEVKRGWEGYHPIPIKDHQVISKNDRTYIRPIFDAPSYRIDGFELKLGEDDYFYRKGLLARGDPERPDSLEKLASFEMVSHGANELRFEGFQSKDLLIVLKDQDLPSLSIKGVKAYQREQSLLFRAKGDGKHLLKFGDREARAPSYDLPHFKEQMPDSLKTVGIGEIHWNGPPLSEWVEKGKKEENDRGYRIFTTIGIILIWIFGVTVFVSIGLLIYRRVL